MIEQRASPYVGLEPFAEPDADVFFGRDRERRIVEANLRAARLTLLYGPPGVGKSSLLRAGVMAQLRTRSPAVVMVNRWDMPPLETLTAELRRSTAHVTGVDQQPGEQLSPVLARTAEAVGRVYVIFDQFEDYFTYQEGATYFEDEFSWAVTDPHLQAHFLISLREDALSRLDRFSDRIPDLFANYVRVGHLDEQAAAVAITRPIEVYNRGFDPPYEIEPELVEEVISEIRRSQTTGASDRIETAFLQVVMERLWSDAREQDVRLLTASRLRELGGAREIVADTVQHAMQSLKTDEQDIAAQVLRFLVLGSGAKLALSITELAELSEVPASRIRPVVDALVRDRVLRSLAPSPDAGATDATRYEIFHDVIAPMILDWRRKHVERQARARAARRAAGIAIVVLLLLVILLLSLIAR